MGIQRDGTKEVLGIWIQQSEGAKFWLGIMNELNHRGLKDILVALIDGLKGFPGILATHRPGAIMDKSGRQFVARSDWGANAP